MTQDKNFYLKEGSVLRNLKDLAKSLKGMPSHIYEHHVSNFKNDFSSWVKDSLGEVKLADRIEGQIAKIEMELEVLRHLVHESGKNTKKQIKKNINSKKFKSSSKNQSSKKSSSSNKTKKK